MGEVRVHGHHLGLDALERGEVAGVPGLHVGLIDMPVLVAVQVLEIEHVGAVGLPEEDADAALLVGGDHLVIRLAERPHPDVQDVVGVGGQIGQAGAVGRDPRAGLVGIAEEHFARDEGRLGGG